MNKEDYADIRKLTENKAALIVDNLIASIGFGLYSPGNVLGSHNCPFCWISSTSTNKIKGVSIINNKNCILCGYQKRHGYCLLSQSTYREILNFVYYNKINIFSVKDKKNLFNTLTEGGL